jgi:hypothetical protein
MSKFRPHNVDDDEIRTEGIEGGSESERERKKLARVRKTLHRLQNIPLIGRFLCHGTGFYWLGLQEMSVGACEWDDE